MNAAPSIVSGTNMNTMHHQPIFSDTSLLHQRVSICKEPPKRVLHLEKGRRNFLKESSRRKKNSFPRTSLPPVSEEGISNVRSPQYATVGPQKVVVKVKLVNPQVIHLREDGDLSRIESVEASEVLYHQLENACDDMSQRRTVIPLIRQRTNIAPNPEVFQQNNKDYPVGNDSFRENTFRNLSIRSRSLPSNSATRSNNSTNNNLNESQTDSIDPSVANDQRKLFLIEDELQQSHGNSSQKPGNMYSKLTANLDPQYKKTADHFRTNLSNNNTVESPGQNGSYCNTLRMLQNGTGTQMESLYNTNIGTVTPKAPDHPCKEIDYSNDCNAVISNAQDKDLKYANHFREERNMPVSSPSEMSSRQAWVEIQKRNAKMREEFFKMSPTENRSRDMTNGRLKGRRSKSEPRLNALKSEINKNQNILRENSKRDSAPLWTTPRVSSPDLTKQLPLFSAQYNNTDTRRASLGPSQKSYSNKNNPKPTDLHLKGKVASRNKNVGNFHENDDNKKCQEQYNTYNTNCSVKEISNLLANETAANSEPLLRNNRWSTLESNTHPNVTRPTPAPRRSRSVAATRPHSLEHFEDTSNKVDSMTHGWGANKIDSTTKASYGTRNPNKVDSTTYGSFNTCDSNKVGSTKQSSYKTRGQTADIHLTRDPNLAHQRVTLVTHVCQVSPNVTVTRYRVPSIPYRQKWEWVQKYGQDQLLSDQNRYLSRHSQPVAEDGNYRHHDTLRDDALCPTSPVSSSSISSPDDLSCSASSFTLSEKAIRSPTPSSGYNSCSNACSPSPIPSPDSCYTHPIMGETSSTHYTTKPHRNYRNSCSSPTSVSEPYNSTPSTSRKNRNDSFGSDYLSPSALDTSDWSEMSCGRKTSDQDSSSSSSSSGCYSGASSPTPLAPPLAPHIAEHRPLPSAL